MIYNREKILKRIKPPEEEIKKGLDLCNEIKEFIKKKFGMEAELQGSFAKGTSLKGDKDLDIFVFFPLDKTKKELKKKALKVGKNVFKEFKGEYEIKYAEHPYVNGVIKNHDIDIVPCYKIKTIDEMKSSVDRTPLHTRLVHEKMTNEQKDETKILKKFMKLVNVYGSEFKVMGFSGYICELLVIRYGSFEETLKNASQWKRNQRISFDSSELPFEDPLIIIDPVDPKRNAASCVSLQKLSEFIHRSREFLKDKKFEKVKIEYAQSQGTELLVLNFETEIMEELLFPQLRKTKEFIQYHLKKNGFRVYRTGVFNAGILFEFEVSSVPEMKIHEGPFIYDRENCEKFIEKHGAVFIVDDRICTKTKREFRTARECIDALIEKKEGFGKDLKKTPCSVTTKAPKKIYD